MSNARYNLRRRIVRFNKSNAGLAFDIPDLSTKAGMRNAERQLTKAQAKAKFLKSKQKTINAALDLGIKLNPNKIKGKITLDRAIEKVKIAKSFSLAQKRYVERLTKYNNLVHSKALNKDGDKLYLLPRTPVELKEARRVLNHLEKAEVQKARDLLGVEKGRRLSAHSAELDRKRAGVLAQPTLEEYKYHQIVMREVHTSHLPELEQLFLRIGWQGVNVLAAANFKISDFIDSDGLLKVYSREEIIDTLDAIAPNLPPTLRGQVQAFLKDL